MLKLGSSSDPDYHTGSILWDTSRKNILYASSEPVGDDQVGIHKIFDVKRGREIVKLGVNEAGDAMALDHNHGGWACVSFMSRISHFHDGQLSRWQRKAKNISYVYLTFAGFKHAKLRILSLNRFRARLMDPHAILRSLA